MDYCGVVTSALVMCSTVMNSRFLEMVFMKRLPFMNMMYPASVNSLCLYKRVIGMGKIAPLMCGVLFLGIFPFRHPVLFPQMSSAPLTSS